MNLTSKTFEAGEMISIKYTCQGENISPPLEWTKVPREAKSLALICDDPDASSSFGPFSHWVVYAIPADRSQLEEGIERDGRLPEGGLQGRNDFGNIGYGGPYPPRGETHRYYWRLFALDEPCELGPGATRQQVLDWATNHTIEQSELVAQFG